MKSLLLVAIVLLFHQVQSALPPKCPMILDVHVQCPQGNTDQCQSNSDCDSGACCPMYCGKVCLPSPLPRRMLPDVCSLPPVEGLCKGAFTKWFFNVNSKQCEQFSYGGCGGNENRFDTEIECQAKCDVCKLPREPGPCKGSFPRWFFNVFSRRCEVFSYGGCHGNQNNFPSEERCKNKCYRL